MDSYTYDWADGRCTTDDPRHAGRLTPGRHNHVSLDGVELTRGVRRFATGPAGWVELVEYDQDGRPMTEVYDRQTGAVRYRGVPEDADVWQVLVPGPDGKDHPKYDERLAVRVVRGRVEFWVDEPAAAGVGG